MKTKNLCACRGDGRGYLSVRVTEFTYESRLGLAGSTRGGNLVPTQLYVIDESDTEKTAVFVFPLSECDIVLKLKETDADGVALGETLTIVRPAWLKWNSRLNYRLKADECARIRDIDSTDFYRHATIELTECIPGQNTNILRAVLTIPAADPIPYTFALLDEQFRPLKTDCVVMSDSVRPQESYAPTALRQLVLSIRIPRTQKTYTLHFTDSSGKIRSNFAILEPDLHRALLGRNRIKTLNASQDARYPLWTQDHFVKEADQKEQRLSTFGITPLVSVIVPLYKTPRQFFRDMVESVLGQTYDNLELILVNADPENDEVAELISEAISKDERVIEKRLKKNLGISLNTEAGIQTASGSYIAFLDHDDVLEPNALYEYVAALNSEPDIDLLYCDEDKLYGNGSLGDPYFKPDYSPHLLREINYICHFLMVRTSLLKKLDPADPIFDGAQDHRMILQAVAKGAQVHHVAKILYHWRVSTGSTASGTGEKPYADKAGKLALDEHFKTLAIPAEVLTTDQACRYRVNYLVEGTPLVSIIIPSKDNADVLNVCISSILKRSTYNNFEIVVVENNSTDISTFDYYDSLVQRDSRIKVIRWEHEFNFSKLINFGAEHARGEYLLLLNNDTEVISPSWIETMLGICQEQTVGAVGAKLHFRDGTIQHAGVYVQGRGAGHLNLNLDAHDSGYFNTTTTTRDISAVTAACLLTKRSAFEAAKGFSEKFAVAFNDVDFCLKIRALGLLVVFTPHAELFHYESLSRGYETTVAKQTRFHREASMLHVDWPEYYVLGDPFINPNLYPDSCYFQLDFKDDSPST